VGGEEGDVDDPDREGGAVARGPAQGADALVRNGLDESARQLGLSLVRFDAASPSAVDTALDEIGRQRPDALLVAQDSLFYLTRSKIVHTVARQRAPRIYAFREAVTEGGLMSYANSNPAMFREAARFVARILKGAKALGLTIPPSLLARADQVIEAGASR
jgi:putative tryptophan/tyrosine transport system substrate-binding protein